MTTSGSAADAPATTSARTDAVAYLVLLRLPFQLLLSPIFLWGVLLAGGTLNLTLLVSYLAFHLFGYAGGTALNSYYDRDEGPVGGLAHPPRNPPHLLEFSLVWQAIGLVLALSVNLTVAAIYFVMFWMSLAYSHPRVRLKGKPIAALVTVMLGQGILPFYAGWATAQGNLANGLGWVALLGAVSGTLITGGMYPLTQTYQLDADARRGDLTAARALGVDNSFRLALGCVAVGGLGAFVIAWTQFSPLEGLGLLGFIGVLMYCIKRWWSRFASQSVMQNFTALMRLYAGVTLPFLFWILLRLIWATWFG